MDESHQGLSIIIPAYNEQGAISDLLLRVAAAMKSVPDTLHEIIVVDDGSSDTTSEEVKGENVRLVRHPKNLGYGRSIMSGIRYSRFENIAIMDADGTYSPEELVKMIPLMQTFDMVIGVRSMKHVRQSIFVKLLRLMLKLIIWYFTETVPPDPNSGLRIFKKAMAIEGYELFSMKFSFSTSLTMFAYLTNRFVEHIPIEYHTRIGFSKVRHIRDSIKTLLLIISMSLIYKTMRCYLVHMLLTCGGLAALLFLKPLLGIDVWLISTVGLIVLSILTAMGYIAYILGITYRRVQNKG